MPEVSRGGVTLCGWDNSGEADFGGSFSIKAVLGPLVGEDPYAQLEVAEGQEASAELARLLLRSGSSFADVLMGVGPSRVEWAAADGSVDRARPRASRMVAHATPLRSFSSRLRSRSGVAARRRSLARRSQIWGVSRGVGRLGSVAAGTPDRRIPDAAAALYRTPAGRRLIRRAAPCRPSRRTPPGRRPECV